MITLSEKDADRIALYLRRQLKRLQDENSLVEGVVNQVRSDMLNSHKDDSNLKNVLTVCGDICLQPIKEAEIEVTELLALLMVGSEG